MDVYADFLAALCGSYDKFVEKLSKKCKKTGNIALIQLLAPTPIFLMRTKLRWTCQVQ
jgi:hypothetical protein